MAEGLVMELQEAGLTVEIRFFGDPKIRITVLVATREDIAERTREWVARQVADKKENP